MLTSIYCINICNQLVNHGISEELLERVKKVSSECYKLREEAFKESTPAKLLNDLLEGNDQSEAADEQLKNLDWEDVFVLQDDNEWPSQPAEFK